MTNLQGASVLLQSFNMSNHKLNIQKDKLSQTNDIITTYYDSIEEGNQKPKETESQRITQNIFKVKGGKRQEQNLINNLNNITYSPNDKHNHYLTTTVKTYSKS